jgi:hypothetical protein
MGGFEVWIHAFLISALCIGDWPAARSECCNVGETARNTDWVEGVGGSCSRFGRSELSYNVSRHVGIAVVDGWTIKAG